MFGLFLSKTKAYSDIQLQVETDNAQGSAPNGLKTAILGHHSGLPVIFGAELQNTRIGASHITQRKTHELCLYFKNKSGWLHIHFRLKNNR